MHTKRSLTESGNWYKGNLHCHSVLSDGKLTADELIDSYRNRGYHFLAFSEHQIFTDYREKNTDDFIILPAFEYSYLMEKDDYREFHFNVFAGSGEMLKNAVKPLFAHEEIIEWKKFNSNDIDIIQRFIDDMLQRGCIVMLNHPNWSNNSFEDLRPLKNLFALEVYNHSSQHLENKGEGGASWDFLLRSGSRLWGTATDDNHNDHPLHSSYSDSFGGWIMVRAESLSQDTIIDALINGSFYSSTGPEIYSFEINNDQVFFECSPVEKIYLLGDKRQVKAKLGTPLKNTLTQFAGQLDGTEKYVRFECVDANGRRAYTNPIFLED